MEICRCVTLSGAQRGPYLIMSGKHKALDDHHRFHLKSINPCAAVFSCRRALARARKQVAHAMWKNLICERSYRCVHFFCATCNAWLANPFLQHGKALGKAHFFPCSCLGQSNAEIPVEVIIILKILLDTVQEDKHIVELLEQKET
jgi:hypothetical protein